MKNKKVGYITKVAVLSAAAAIVMLIELPIAFYRLDLSEVFVLMGGFSLGPVAAILIELIKNLLNLLLNGTITAGVGELANFLLGCSFTVPAALIYKHHKSKKQALIGCLVGGICLLVAAIPMNVYVLVPAYAAAFGATTADIVAMGTKLIPAIDSLPKLMLLLTAPFNLVKAFLSTLVTLLLYKKLSPILHK